MPLSFVTLALLLFAAPPIVGPDDLESGYNNLKKAVEASSDPSQVKKLAVDTCALAREAASEAAPEAGDEKEAWNQRVAHARDVERFTEYALYVTAVKSPPATTVDLLSTLEQQNPKSKYLDGAYANYIYALHQTGGAAKIVPMAEKAVVNFPDNEDLLLVLTDNAMTRKQNDRALAYAERLIAVLNKHPKPDNLSAADWEKKRTAALGRSRWVAGVMHSEKQQYYEADKDLRAALPLVKGNDTMYSSALFYLGIANYQIGSTTRNRALVNEAASFSDQAAKMGGPLADQAWKNAQAMKLEAAKIR